MTDCKLRTIPSLRVEGFTFDLQRFATDTWDGTASSVPAAVNNVITITTAEQLAALAKNVNDEDNSNNYSGVTIKLGADLDLNGDNYSWTPIGTEYNPFSGTFDGDGHTISNLKINSDKSGVGLFSIIDGTIMNVTLNNVDVTGWDHVGGLVGLNVGSVENCTVTNATVSGTDLVGGLVGRNYNGTVSGNTVSGTVSGNTNVGGLVGQNDGNVTDNTVSGTVSGNGNSNRVGGLVGGNGGNVTDNTVSGTVSGNENVGGLVGENYKGTVKDNSFYSNKGDVGSNDDGTVSGNTKLYKLTVPSGVEATATGTGNKVVADNGNYYAAGTVTLKASAANAIIRSTNSSYTNNNGIVSVTVNADTNISSNDIAFYYKLTLQGVTVDSGTGYGGNYSDYYTGTVTLAAKTGYNLSQTSLTVTKAETITATLASGVYVFSTDDGATYQLATADNVKSNNYPNLQQAYQLTLPSGVTAANGVITADGNYYMIPNSEVTLTIGTGAALVGVTGIDNVAADSSGQIKITPTADVTVTADNLYYAVSGLDNVTASGGTYTTVSGTNYYKSGSSVTLTAGTGAIIGAATASGGSVTVNSNGTATLTTTSSAATVTPTLYYKLTLPNGFTASGTGYGGNYSDYYTGNVTIAERTGYSLSQTSIENISSATEITATVDTTNHYAFKDGDGYKYATNSNVASNNYPDLVQVYALTLPDGVTVTGDKVATDSDGKYYAADNVTITAANGYSLQNVTINGESLTDNFTFTVSADTTITADSVKFGNGGKSVEVGGTTGDFGSNNGVYSISASQENSTVVGNTNNNNVIIAGGGENILTGGGGNDTYTFSAGGGIVTDYGIGSTKDSTGKTLSAPLGTDVIKVDGEVKGVYFDRDASSKKSATFTAVITYGTGDDTQIIVLQNINKKPTKYSSDPSKVVYQTNDAAAATLKIWDTSGTKQAILSAAKLKKLFKDDSELDTLGDLVRAKITYLGDIADGKTPTTNPFEQTTTITPNGNDNG